MFSIFSKKSNVVHKSDDLVESLVKLNSTLEKLNPLHSYIDLETYSKKSLVWVGDEDTVYFHLDSVDQKYIHYFLLKKDDLTDSNIKNLQNYDVKTYTDIVVAKPLTNIFVLFDYFNLNKDMLYQSFIYYLGKTVEKNDDINSPNIVKIINFFSHNEEYNSKLYNLFYYFLDKKNLTPFNITYKSYD